jgi:hypothetical protein
LQGRPGDGAADLVTIDGTGDNAHLTVHSHDTRVDGKGMTAKSSISGAETIDKLRINCRGGDDKVAVAHHVSTILGVDVNLGSANSASRRRREPGLPLGEAPIVRVGLRW